MKQHEVLTLKFFIFRDNDADADLASFRRFYLSAVLVFENNINGDHALYFFGLINEIRIVYLELIFDIFCGHRRSFRERAGRSFRINNDPGRSLGGKRYCFLRFFRGLFA